MSARTIGGTIAALAAALVIYAMFSGMFGEHERRSEETQKQEAFEQHRDSLIRTQADRTFEMVDDLVYRGIPKTAATAFADEYFMMSARRTDQIPDQSLSYHGPGWEVTACLRHRTGILADKLDTLAVTANGATGHYAQVVPNAPAHERLNHPGEPCEASGSWLVSRTME